MNGFRGSAWDTFRAAVTSQEEGAAGREEAGEAGEAEGGVGGGEELPAWRHVSMLEPADFDAKVPPDLVRLIRGEGRGVSG